MQSIFKKEIDMCKLTAHTHTYHIIIFFLNLNTLCCDFLYVLLGVSASHWMTGGKEMEIFVINISVVGLQLPHTQVGFFVHAWRPAFSDPYCLPVSIGCRYSACSFCELFYLEKWNVWGVCVCVCVRTPVSHPPKHPLTCFWQDSPRISFNESQLPPPSQLKCLGVMGPK